MRLIDADELKKAIDKYCEDYQGFDGVIDIIDNAPTVEPNLKEIYQEGHYDGHREGYEKAINEERPQGEWIIVKSPLSTETIVKCPYCKDEFIGNGVEDYNFCPICGAQMKRGGET